jgi:hypothetical protein
MKRLNEGPIVKTDHKGNHLQDTNGQVTQSFPKGRAGLKSARQAMYKNFKGLNVKQEPEQPVEEGIHDDVAQIQQRQKAEDPRDQMARYNAILNRNPNQSQSAIKQNQQAFDADADTKYDWNKPAQFKKPTQRQLDLNKQAKASRAGFVVNENEQVQYDAHGFATVHQNGTFYLIFNDEVVGEYDTVDELKAAHEHVINKIKLPEDQTANIGNTSIRSDGKDIYAKGKIGSTNVSADTKGNAYAKGKIAGGTMATAVNKSGEGGVSFTDNKGRTMSRTAGDSDAWMSPGPNQPSKRIRAEGIDMKLEEEFNKQLEEGMTVNTTANKDPNVEDTVTVNADGDDAKELMQMLKMAGMEGKCGEGTCGDEGHCGSESSCGCDKEPAGEMSPMTHTDTMSQDSDEDALMQMLKMAGMDTDNVTVMPLNAEEGSCGGHMDEDLANAPDEKTADTDYMVNKLAGGINKPKNMYRQAADGDNPMSPNNAMPVSDLEESLKAEYNNFVPEGLNFTKKRPMSPKAKAKAKAIEKSKKDVGEGLRIVKRKPKQPKAPGAQVKGTDRAKPLGKHGEHPFSGKLVGESHDEDGLEGRGTNTKDEKDEQGLEGRGLNTERKPKAKADDEDKPWLKKKIFGKDKE